MKIATTYEGDRICQHFGHTPAFKLYEIENGSVTGAQVMDTCGSGHGALAGLLASWGVEALICGGIGGGARIALAEAGIRVFGGVSGDPDAAVEALLSGSLDFDPNARCSHHDHHESSCGSHGCGSHSCGSH